METINLLFEKNTFENIEQIKGNLQDNANKKKNELRQIIGQSYRDLISISNVIENMLASCDNLTQDIGKLKKFSDQSKFNPKNQNYQSQIDYRRTDDLNLIRLKIIINSPKLILDYLIENDVLTAAVLWRRTKFLCNQFSDEDKRSFKILIHHTIFLDKIHDLIYQKYLDITNYSNYALNDQQLFRTLFAICLLKAESFDQVIYEFLSNRKIQCIDLFNDSSNENVNTKLKFFFSILFNSLEIIFNLYNSIDELSASSIIHQINTVSINYTFLNKNKDKMINKLFDDFRIENFVKSNDGLSGKIEKITSNWFNELKQDSSDPIREYLQATSIDNLYESFDKVKEYFDLKETLILKSHYYEVICKRKINFWDYFISESFNAAWNHFLIKTMIRLFTNLKNKIEYLNDEEHTVLNVFDYIWSIDLNENLNEMHKKYCGTTERIIELINQTNCEFNYLMENFLPSNKNRKEVVHANQKFKIFFYDTFKQQNDEFLVHVEHLIKSSDLKKEQTFNLAHFIRMLVLICSNYKQCFDILNLQTWFKTKEFLLNLSYIGYNSFINQIIEDLVQMFYEEMNRGNQLFNNLHTSANWQEIEIKEQIDGKEVSTKIYVPNQISLPLDNLLTSLTIRLCRLSGHTLPNRLKLIILDELSKNLCVGYEKIYENLEKKPKNSIKTTQILQIYFDLIFLKSLLYHSVNDEQLKIRLQNILTQFQQHIDPFDLHLFSSYIQTNIEQNRSSLSMILNYLLPQNLQIQSFNSSVLTSPAVRNYKLKFNLL